MSPHSLSSTVTTQSLESTAGKSISSGCPVSASSPYTETTTVLPLPSWQSQLIAGIQSISPTLSFHTEIKVTYLSNTTESLLALRDCIRLYGTKNLLVPRGSPFSVGTNLKCSLRSWPLLFFLRLLFLFLFLFGKVAMMHQYHYTDWKGLFNSTLDKAYVFQLCAGSAVGVSWNTIHGLLHYNGLHILTDHWWLSGIIYISCSWHQHLSQIKDLFLVVTNTHSREAQKYLKVSMKVSFKNATIMLGKVLLSLLHTVPNTYMTMLQIVILL